MDELTKFDKPISELAWDIIKSTDKANAFLAIADYLKPLRLLEPDRALKLGLELAPIVAAGLKEYRAEMFGWKEQEISTSGIKKSTMNTIELSEKVPQAYSALPEPYQNDDVMIFYYNNGDLFGKPKDSEIEILGDWTVIYDPKTKSWNED